MGNQLTMRMALVWDCIDLGAYVFWAAIYAPHVETLDQSSFYIINGGVIAVGAWLLFRTIFRPEHAVQYRVFIPSRTQYAPMPRQRDGSLYTHGGPDPEPPVVHPSRYENESKNKGAPDDLPIEALRAEDGDRFASLRGVDGVNPGEAEDDEEATKHRTAQRRQAMDKHRKDSLRFFAQHLYAELLFDLVQSAVIAWMMKEVRMKDEHFELKLLSDFLNIATTFVDVAMIKGPTAAAVTQCNPAEMKKALEGELAPLAKEGGLNYE